MAEEKQGIRSTVREWMKGLITSVLGLASGAALMYLTPVVNNVIKPAKPVSNFAAQVAGMNVHFNNRSTGASQGWWDFGDSSALEPFDPKLETVTHTYEKPGSYTVKLSLQNLIGDESERSATVNIDGETAAPQASVTNFTLQSLTAGETAPALYRLQADVAGATECILCAGDNRPMEIIDGPGHIDRLITFDAVGDYIVRLAAVNGKQLAEKTAAVHVGPGAAGGLLAKLKVSYEAIHVARYAKTWRIHVGWEGDLQQPTSPFRKERAADPGCTISDPTIVNQSDPQAPRDLACQLAPDKSKIILTGELVRPTGLLTRNQTAPAWLAEVKANVERRSPPRQVNRDDVTVAIAPNRTVKIPLQPLGEHWDPVRLQATLELWDHGQKVWSGSPPIANAAVALQGQPMSLTVAQQSDGVVVTLAGGLSVPALPVVLPKPAPPIVPAPAPPLPAPEIVQTPPEPVGPIIRKIDYDPRRPFAQPKNP